jgi:hypothetical protein
MRLMKLNKKWAVPTIVLALIVLVLLGEGWYRCHWKAPLTRDEALQRSTAYLKNMSHDFVLDPLPKLVNEFYTPEGKAWTFEFSNSTCTVDIIDDRCEGTDVGGLSEGCRTKAEGKHGR